MFGITTIHNPSGSKTFWVRLGYGTANCPYIRKSFTTSVYGGIGKARKAAIEFRDEIMREWDIDLEKPLGRPRVKNSKFGVPGINIRECSNLKSHSPLFYLEVLWCTKELRGTATPFVTKKFRIYPDQPNQCWNAFKEAFILREEMAAKHYRNYPLIKHERPKKSFVIQVIRNFASNYHYG